MRTNSDYLMRTAREFPPPRAEFWEWQRRAQCRGMDPAIFFPQPSRHGPASTISQDEARAKAVCDGCPVAAACKAYAIAAAEPYGIWGGMTASERSRVVAREDRMRRRAMRRRGSPS